MILYTISYAQNKEDIIIDAFFKGKKNGYYVDVGANHPVIDSVTKYFYLRGWRGLDIEPNPKYTDLLKADRPEDVIVTKAVSSKISYEVLRSYRGAEGLSTLSSEVKNEDNAVYIPFKQDYDDIKVETDTLASILEEHGFNRVIDFLKVDVEGSEHEVLTSNDWKKYRPELICIETSHIKNDWRDVLTEHDYICFFSDGLNDYYAPKDSSLMKEFSFPEKVLMGYPRVIPFVAHSESLEPDNTFYLEQGDALKKMKLTAKEVIHLSLSSIDGTIKDELIKKIIQLKRDRLDTAIQKSIYESRLGKITGPIRSLSAKILLFKLSLLGYTLLSKLVRKIV